VMIGREAYHNPYLFATVDRDFYGDAHEILSREQVLEAWIPYVEKQLHEGVRLGTLTRHILGLYHGIPGGRYFRRTLTELSQKPDVNARKILDAIPK